LPDGRVGRSLAFLSDRGHPQWAGDLTLDAQADLIAGAKGLSGRNIDYLRDLLAHLREAGIADAGMARLLRMVEAREAPADPRPTR
jgi:cation transport protein ChaC